MKNFYSVDEWTKILKFYFNNRKVRYNDQRWRSNFGVSFSTLQKIWYYISRYIFSNRDKINYIIYPIHLIWTLYFLKINMNWFVASTFLCSDPKTLRKWIYIVVKIINVALKKVNINLFLSN
jgi:hypothetical protein